MRAGIYTRVSHDPSGRGRSVGDQEAECRAEIAAAGWTLAGVYSDNDRGASRYSRKARPDWQRLLGDLRGGVLDVLVTWESSRAQRDLEVYVELRRICRETSTLWRYDGHTYDLTDDDDAYRTGQDALDAEREAGRTRKRVLRAVRSRAAAGRPHGKLLYGYRREYDPATGDYLRTVEHPDQAPVVRELYRRYADGEGMSVIATSLTKRGVPTPQSAPVWRTSTLRNLLTNPGHLGHRASAAGHATVADAWPALIDEATWWRAQARLSDPKRPPRTDPTVKHLLSGLANCGPCGAKMTWNTGRSGRSGRKYPAYVCLDRGCVGRSASGLELHVVEYVLALWDDDPRLGEPTDDPRIGEVEAELGALRTRLEAFQVAGAAPDGPSPAAVAVVERELGPKIAEAERQLSGLRARTSLPDLGRATLREAWPGLGLARQRAIIAASVTVRVLPAGKGKRYDPATVDVQPRW